MLLRVLTVIVWCLALPGWMFADGPKHADGRSYSCIEAFNEFSWKLFRDVSEKNQNVVVSPIGAAVLLAIVADGAHGKTREEIVRALGLEPDGSIGELMKGWKSDVLSRVANDRGGEWRFAQSIWLDSRIDWDKAFSERWRAALGTEFRTASFARTPEGVARAMNDWCDRQTRGAIKSVVGADSFDRETSAFLVSAVFLEKQWESKFSPESTKTQAFFLNENESIQHPLMFQMKRFRLLEAMDFQAIQLPYRQSAAAMIVLLPRSRDGLEKLEASLDGPRFASIWSALQKATPVTGPSGGGFFSVEPDPSAVSESLASNAWDIETQLTLPRFRLQWKQGLEGALKKQGINLAFDREAADLSGMLKQAPIRPVYLTGLRQHAMIEVDEQGTRAAAVTSGGLGSGGEPPKRAVFRADHPFLFVIIHVKTGAVLFLGRVCNPAR